MGDIIRIAWDHSRDGYLIHRDSGVVSCERCHDAVATLARDHGIPIEGGPLATDQQNARNAHAFDPVEKAAHYNQGDIECIVAIKSMLTTEEYRGYLRGTIFAYLWRTPFKERPPEDARKMRWYGDKFIEFLDEQEHQS